MPFVSSCCCPRHEEWKHGEVTSEQLRCCTREEIKWLDIDSNLKSKRRKRKICISCRYRLQIDFKCQKLEVSLPFLCTHGPTCDDIFSFRSFSPGNGCARKFSYSQFPKIEWTPYESGNYIITHMESRWPFLLGCWI